MRISTRPRLERGASAARLATCHAHGLLARLTPGRRLSATLPRAFWPRGHGVLSRSDAKVVVSLVLLGGADNEQRVHAARAHRRLLLARRRLGALRRLRALVGVLVLLADERQLALHPGS